jgi:hypothetical protein
MVDLQVLAGSLGFMGIYSILSFFAAFYWGRKMNLRERLLLFWYHKFIIDQLLTGTGMLMMDAPI